MYHNKLKCFIIGLTTQGLRNNALLITKRVFKRAFTVLVTMCVLFPDFSQATHKINHFNHKGKVEIKYTVANTKGGN